MSWRYLKLNATTFLHSVDVHDSFHHPSTSLNMHATNWKHFLEDSLTEKVVLLGGDYFFLSEKVEAAIPIEAQVPFECLIKTFQNSLPPGINGLNYRQKLLRWDEITAESHS